MKCMYKNFIVSLRYHFLQGKHDDLSFMMESSLFHGVNFRGFCGSSPQAKSRGFFY